MKQNWHWKEFMNRDIFHVGDWIIDHDEGIQGIVTKVGNNIIIKWRGLGEFATPYDLAEEAIKLGDWEIQRIDLSKLTPPSSKRLDKIGF